MKDLLTDNFLGPGDEKSDHTYVKYEKCHDRKGQNVYRHIENDRR